MTREGFDRLVREVEQGIARDHAALRRRTLLLALVGYAGLLVWLISFGLISAGFFAAMIWADPAGKVLCGICGTVILVVGGGASLRFLLPSLSPPTGRRVSREEAPALYAELDALRAALESAPFHEVLLTAECNAAVVQVPRLGLFGWFRNYLLLGLPLLEGLSPSEMRAVLAHEFAHLSRRHGRLSHWLYRLRRSWDEVFRQLSKPRAKGEYSLRPLVVSYVDWFWPRFNAHAFVLSRANEYEADAEAARQAGVASIAAALTRIRFLSELLDQKIWPAIWRLANEQPTPPSDLFARLHQGLKSGADEAERNRWMQEAFQSASTNSDTHPCLTERLGALGASASPNLALAATAPRSAAVALLGDRHEELRRGVQEVWQAEVAALWRERHSRASSLTHRLTAIPKVSPSAGADADRLWDIALVQLRLSGDQDLEPLLRDVLAARADHALAQFHLGRILLDSGRSEGKDHLERAMALDGDLVHNGCGLLHDYYRRIGDAAQLRQIAARLDRHEKELAASVAERSAVTSADTFFAATLSEAELAAVCQALAAESDLARAHLVQKQLTHFPSRRLFVLCVQRPRAWHRLPSPERERELVRRLSQGVRLPGQMLVIAPSGSFGAVAKKILAVAGVEIWPRPASA